MRKLSRVALLAVLVATGCSAFGADDPPSTAPPPAAASDAAADAFAPPEDATGGSDAATDAGEDAADAGKDAAPAGCNGDPNCPHTIFVTSDTHDGNFGGLAGADAFCKQHADAVATLAGRAWIAWLSDDTTSAGARVTHANAGYVLTDGALVAASYADLTDGNLLAPIDRDEGSRAVGSAAVWTATTAAGVATTPTCSNWNTALAGAMGRAGSTSATDGQWTEKGDQGCMQTARIYCVEK